MGWGSPPRVTRIPKKQEGSVVPPAKDGNTAFHELYPTYSQYCADVSPDNFEPVRFDLLKRNREISFSPELPEDAPLGQNHNKSFSSIQIPSFLGDQDRKPSFSNPKTNITRPRLETCSPDSQDDYSIMICETPESQIRGSVSTLSSHSSEHSGLNPTNKKPPNSVSDCQVAKKITREVQRSESWLDGIFVDETPRSIFSPNSPKSDVKFQTASEILVNPTASPIQLEYNKHTGVLSKNSILGVLPKVTSPVSKIENSPELSKGLLRVFNRISTKQPSQIHELNYPRRGSEISPVNPPKMALRSPKCSYKPYQKPTIAESKKSVPKKPVSSEITSHARPLECGGNILDFLSDEEVPPLKPPLPLPPCYDIDKLGIPAALCGTDGPKSWLRGSAESSKVIISRNNHINSKGLSYAQSNQALRQKSSVPILKSMQIGKAKGPLLSLPILQDLKSKHVAAHKIHLPSEKIPAPLKASVPVKDMPVDEPIPKPLMPKVSSFSKNNWLFQLRKK